MAFALQTGLRLKNQVLILLEPLSKTNLCLEWNLQRKLSEKISGSFDFFETAFIFKGVKADSLSLAKLLVESRYSGKLSGANEFDGIKWFNKEKMEASLKAAVEILTAGKTKTAAAKIETLVAGLDEAQKNSGYRCENFLNFFAPKKKKKSVKTADKSAKTAKSVDKSADKPASPAKPAKEAKTKKSASGKKTAGEEKTEKQKKSRKKTGKGSGTKKDKSK